MVLTNSIVCIRNARYTCDGVCCTRNMHIITSHRIFFFFFGSGARISVVKHRPELRGVAYHVYPSTPHAGFDDLSVCPREL